MTKPTLAEIQQAIFVIQAFMNNYEQGIPDKDYTPIEQAQRYEQAKKNLAQLLEYQKGSTKRVYYIQNGIGKAKYVINYHDGIQKHKDGSNFYDIRIFHNKKDLAKFELGLHKEGYSYKRWNEPL